MMMIMIIIIIRRTQRVSAPLPPSFASAVLGKAARLSMAASARRTALLLLAAAAHAACWTPPIAVRGRVAAQRQTALLVDQAAPFRVTMRPDAAGALGVEVDANECGAAVITSIVRGSHVSELLEVGDALQPGRTRAPSAQGRPPLCTGCACDGKGPAHLPWHRAAQRWR